VQRREFDLSSIVQENNYPRDIWMNRRVIGSGNWVLSSVARPDFEWLKWREMKKLSNSGDHCGILSETVRSLNYISEALQPTRLPLQVSESFDVGTSRL